MQPDSVANSCIFRSSYIVFKFEHQYVLVNNNLMCFSIDAFTLFNSNLSIIFKDTLDKFHKFIIM